MQPHSPRYYYAYIMSNRSKTLYTGVTNNVVRRAWEHKAGTASEFTKKYNLDRLVYFERFTEIRRAIVSTNPAWRDLSAEWYGQYQPRQSA